MNFARLNHILLPATSEERDRLRKGWLVKLTWPMIWLYGALSEEGRGLLVLLLFIGTAGLEVATTQVYILWALLVGLLVATLCVRRFFALRKVHAEVHAAPRIVAGGTTTFTITMRNVGDREHLALRTRGPFLPWDGSWLGKQPRVASIAPGATQRLEVHAKFVQRGRHHIDPFEICALVPLGLSVGPAVQTSSCHFMVVPRIPPIASISLPLGRRYQPGGVANASQTGEAMELMGVRPYRPGDPVRDLHPKTWARIGTPHVREYQQEYFARIGVIVDNAKDAVTEQGFEAAISLAAGVVAKLTRGEALIDLLVMGAEVRALTVGRALGSLDQALDVLACAEPADTPVFEQVVLRLQPYLARLSCIVVITQSADDSRLELVRAIEQRGIACRLLRIHDDSGRVFTNRQGKPVPARIDTERVLTVTQINDERPLTL